MLKILTTAISDETQEEFDEQIRSAYRRSDGRAEAERELTAQGDALLGQIGTLAEGADEYLVYIGLAFHRRLQFANKTMLERLIGSDPCPTTVLESLRTQKLVRVAASAKPAWDGLWDQRPQAMWSAVILNFREQFKVAPVEAVAEDDAESEEDEDDMNEDIDDDN